MKQFYWILISFIFLGQSSQAQTQYYVSTTGNNSNTGLSTNQAWETIQYAMNNATPNSVVNILSGTYNEKVEVNVSGTSGNTITFQNYNNDVVNITGTGISYPDAIIGIFDQSFIIIKGLHLKDNQQLDAQGIIVEGDCSYIEIRENEVSDIHFSSNPNAVANSSTNSQPIIVYGSNASNAVNNLIIDGNIVRDSRTGYSEGLAVNGNVDGFEVTNNTVYGIANIGIDIIGHENTATSNDQARNGLIKNNIVYDCISPYATAGGIYVDGGKDLIIENNIVYECQWGIEVGCENIGKTTSNVIVRNNLIYNNEDAGIALGGYDFPNFSGKVIDCTYTNNTCFGNDTNNGGVGGVTGEINITYTENCTLKNNIFFASNSSDIVLYVDDVSSIGLAFDYNLFYMDGAHEFEYEGNIYTSFSSYQSGASQDANSIFGDPKYKDVNLDDFHLLSNSPCIDTGDPNHVVGASEEDIDGDARVNNGTIDIGADEYYISTDAHIVALDNDIEIFPNPFTDSVIIDGDLHNFNVKIFDEFGSLISDLSNELCKIQIDLTGLGAGVYFVLVEKIGNQDLSVHKIIKQ